MPPTDAADCATSFASLATAVAPGGACAACNSYTGFPAGCVGSCPLCVNALTNLQASCAGNTTAVSYTQLTAFADFLNPLSDCFDVLTAASFATVGTCSDAFDLVVTYTESAANPAVAVSPKDGSITAPWPCMLATPKLCPQGCQADLDLLASGHSPDFNSHPCLSCAHS